MPNIYGRFHGATIYYSKLVPVYQPICRDCHLPIKTRYGEVGELYIIIGITGPVLVNHDEFIDQLINPINPCQCNAESKRYMASIDNRLTLSPYNIKKIQSGSIYSCPFCLVLIRDYKEFIDHSWMHRGNNPPLKLLIDGNVIGGSFCHLCHDPSTYIFGHVVPGDDEWRTTITANELYERIEKSKAQKLFKSDFEEYVVKNVVCHKCQPFYDIVINGGFLHSSQISIDKGFLDSSELLSFSGASGRLGGHEMIFDYISIIPKHITIPSAVCVKPIDFWTYRGYNLFEHKDETKRLAHAELVLQLLLSNQSVGHLKGICADMGWSNISTTAIICDRFNRDVWWTYKLDSKAPLYGQTLYDMLCLVINYLNEQYMIDIKNIDENKLVPDLRHIVISYLQKPEDEYAPLWDLRNMMNKVYEDLEKYGKILLEFVNTNNLFVSAKNAFDKRYG